MPKDNKMPRKSLAVKNDGKDYTFTPGKNGSLISIEKKQPVGMDLLGKSVAKTIISPELKNKALMAAKRKNREGIVKTLSIRG